MNWKCEINCQKKEYQKFLFLNKVTLIIDATVQTLGLSHGGYLILSIVDTTTMKQINSEYYPFKEVSDVLTFPLSDNRFQSHELNPLGEIYFCYPVVLQDSLTAEVNFEQNSASLFVHGFLHLLGYEHKNIKDQELMDLLSEEILKLAKIINK